MGIGSRATLAASLGFAVSFVVACGGGNGLLSSDQASSLNAQLGSVSSAVAAGKCGVATSAARAFSNQVADLPPKISTTLVQNLGQGAATVGQLAAKDCQSANTSSSTSSSSPTTTETVTSTTTATNPTSSSSSSSSSSSTTETNPPPPSSSSTTTGGGNGGAGFGGTGTGGNGNGNGGNGQ